MFGAVAYVPARRGLSAVARGHARRFGKEPWSSPRRPRGPTRVLCRRLCAREQRHLAQPGRPCSWVPLVAHFRVGPPSIASLGSARFASDLGNILPRDHDRLSGSVRMRGRLTHAKWQRAIDLSQRDFGSTAYIEGNPNRRSSSRGKMLIQATREASDADEAIDGGTDSEDV